MDCDNLLTINEIYRYAMDKYHNIRSQILIGMKFTIRLLSYNLSDLIVKSEMINSLTFCIFVDSKY